MSASRQTAYHVSTLLRTSGFDDADVAEALRLWKQLHESGAGRGSRAHAVDQIRQARSRPWFEASRLPLPDVTLKPPLGVVDLIFFEPLRPGRGCAFRCSRSGELDVNVPVDCSRAAIIVVLARNDNLNVTTHVFPAAEHNFLVVPLSAERDFPRATPELNPTIVRWLRSRFAVQ